MSGAGWNHEAVERNRRYADTLDTTATAYAIAAEATGLRRDAAAYLRAEANRLHNEADAWRTTCAEQAERLERLEAGS
jgi:hypothetical protein